MTLTLIRVSVVGSVDSRLSELSKSKIWSSVPFDLEQGITVMTRNISQSVSQYVAAESQLWLEGHELQFSEL
jgi:hypothetical protein